MGDSRKYPYPIMGGINILTPLAFGNSKILYPMLSKFQKHLFKPLPPLWNFGCFSDLMEFLFVCLKLLMDRKFVFFPSSKKILLTIFGHGNKQLKFVIDI